MDSTQEDAFESYWEELGDAWVGASPKDIAKEAWLDGYYSGVNKQRTRSILDPYSFKDLEKR